MNKIEMIDNIEFVKEDDRVRVELLLQGKDVHGFKGDGPSVFDAISNLMAGMKMEFEDLQRVKKELLVPTAVDRRTTLEKFFGVI